VSKLSQRRLKWVTAGTAGGKWGKERIFRAMQEVGAGGLWANNGTSGGKNIRMALRLMKNRSPTGRNLCYFLNTTITLWSLELTCIDAG
jgi:hypothetical protein